MWRWIIKAVSWFSDPNTGLAALFKSVLGEKEFAMLESLVKDANKIKDLTPEERRDWVEKEASGLVIKHSEYLIRSVIEFILARLK